MEHENTELRAKLEVANAERDRLTKMLHSLTPMGSEFVNNPDRCVKWIQESLSNGIRQAVKANIGWQKAEAERDALAARVAAMEGVLRALVEAPCTHLPDGRAAIIMGNTTLIADAARALGMEK